MPIILHEDHAFHLLLWTRCKLNDMGDLLVLSLMLVVCVHCIAKLCNDSALFII